MAVETIAVIQADIDSGVRSSPTRCFLWKCLNRVHPEIVNLMIVGEEIRVNNNVIPLPAIVKQNLLLYDQLGEIEPFSFDIDLLL